LIFDFSQKFFILQQCLNPNPNPYPNPNFLFGFGFGSSQKIRIISDSDSDPQHWYALCRLSLFACLKRQSHKKTVCEMTPALPPCQYAHRSLNLRSRYCTGFYYFKHAFLFYYKNYMCVQLYCTVYTMAGKGIFALTPNVQT
jgi:hypothetical protein